MQSKAGKTLDVNIRENHLLEAIAQLQNEKGKLEQELQQLKAKHQTVILESRGRSATVTESHQFDEEKKYQMEEVQSLRAQLDKLHLHMAELEQSYQDKVNTYRTHLLSAVQGHMDPDVKEALHSIIEMRSMEQFC
ncbi:hypothetical protein C0Q70_20536 [Pomacea canaliculata]|uniref:Uncharacterized protein n=3 Tax=Pomacea canaliculata TaxID=400727 RepID=A0A2T7NFY1_POMCA|nr:hypothetical protein C0Q70_20536 [Pomacea canaliculata]